MIEAFIATLLIAVAFSLFAFWTMATDIKEESLRPAWLLGLAGAAWIFTIATLVMPTATTTNFSVHNITTSNVPLSCVASYGTSIGTPTSFLLYKSLNLSADPADSTVISPNGEFLYLADVGDGAIYTINTSSFTEINLSGTSNQYHSLAIASNGSVLYGAYSGLNVDVINVSTMSTVDSFTVSAFDISRKSIQSLLVTPGNVLYAGSTGIPVLGGAVHSQIDVIDLTDESTAAQIYLAGADSVQSMTYLAATNTLLAADDNGGIYFINTTTYTVTKVLFLGIGSQSIASANSDSNFYVSDINGSEIITVSSDDAQFSFPTPLIGALTFGVSPNGHILYVADGGSPQVISILVNNSDSGMVVPCGVTTQVQYFPAYNQTVYQGVPIAGPGIMTYSIFALAMFSVHMFLLWLYFIQRAKQNIEKMT